MPKCTVLGKQWSEYKANNGTIYRSTLVTYGYQWNGNSASEGLQVDRVSVPERTMDFKDIEVGASYIIAKTTREYNGTRRDVLDTIYKLEGDHEQF